MQLKKYKPKDYRKKIEMFVLIGMCIGLLTGIFLYHSFASFETNTTIPFMNGNIEDLGDVYFAYYIDNSKHTAYKTIVEDIEGVVLK